MGKFLLFGKIMNIVLEVFFLLFFWVWDNEVFIVFVIGWVISLDKVLFKWMD